jgi:ankyrin repeat protein
MRDDFNDKTSPLWEATNAMTQALRHVGVRLGEVQRYLDAGVAMDAVVVNKETFLTLAAFWGHVEIAAELIKRGAPLDCQNIHGETALTYALDKGHKEIATMLLDAGANVLLRRSYSSAKSAMELAHAHGWTDVCEKIEALAQQQLPALAAAATVLENSTQAMPRLRLKGR